MSLAEVGIVYGTVPWVWMIMLPGDRAGAVPGRVSLVPLRDLLTIAAAGPLTATGQVVGNLLVFAALGFFARPGSGPATVVRPASATSASHALYQWLRPGNSLGFISYEWGLGGGKSVTETGRAGPIAGNAVGEGLFVEAAVGHGGGDEQSGEVVAEGGEGQVVEVDDGDVFAVHEVVPDVRVLVEGCWRAGAIE
ncbi:hypothetical protein B0E53_00954 [Micromonospora sp. MH33]|nr:hypothetical protein B0E53_00954 [Micromonospora sp. MH33]